MLELTLEDREEFPYYSYFYEHDLETIYFNLSWLKNKGHKQVAQILNTYFLKDFICIMGECFNQCDDCPVEKIMRRL